MPTAPSLLFLSQVKPLILLFSSQGRHYHSLSVIDNGRELVACGGIHTLTDCISWRSGQDGWTHYATLRLFKDITLPFISILFSSQARYYHAAVVIRDQIILVGGRRSRFTGEIVKGEFAYIGKSVKHWNILIANDDQLQLGRSSFPFKMVDMEPVQSPTVGVSSSHLGAGVTVADMGR